VKLKAKQDRPSRRTDLHIKINSVWNSIIVPSAKHDKHLVDYHDNSLNALAASGSGKKFLGLYRPLAP